MTLIELKEKVAESTNKEWFQNYTLILNYPHLNYKTSFKGVVSIYEFILNQVEGFNTIQNLPKELVEVRNTFIEVRKKIIQLVTSNIINKNQWDSDLYIIINNTPKIFLFDSLETGFLIRVNQEYPIYYKGAYEYITGNLSNANNKNDLSGYIMAYEFTSKDFSLIAERKDVEKKSILKTRSEFQKSLEDSEAHLINYLAQANQKYKDYAIKIDEFKKEKEDEFYNWYDKTVKEFDSFNLNSNKIISELEVLYRKKLMLEAPARYWRDRGKKLRREGLGWLSGLVISIGVTVYILLFLLSSFTDENILKVFEHTGTAIKWSILLITTVSFLAFIIRSFSKLTFSSFHLMRDAEEKEQLTYVYLSLAKDKSIDPTERHLVMQSLFSRADSGLLKDDATPTMPGNILDKAIATKP